MEGILAEQAAYYRARAAEYDEWFFRRGRYDRGPEFTAKWFAEVDIVREALDSLAPSGNVLEFACGTGLWTERLLPHARALTCVDASAEMIAINRARVGPGNAKYIQADLFEWTPDRTYDFVFFGFWLSHVPQERFDTFWKMVRQALAPNGRVFFVDSQSEPTSAAVDHESAGPDASTSVRKLNDGREFTIVKVFYEPSELEKRLEVLGFEAEVKATPSYFLFGSCVAVDS